jgi:hypothetical protein
MKTVRTILTNLAGAGLATLCISTAQAETALINVVGAFSYDVEGSASNTRMSVSLAPGAHVTAVGWAVSLTANSPGWLTEMKVSLLDSTGTVGINLTPGYADNFSGTASYSSGGAVDLTGGGSDFYVGANGLLNVQYFEDYNDLTGADGTWNSGLLTVEYSVSSVPEPASWALWSGGLLIGLGLRRHAARVAA